MRPRFVDLQRGELEHARREHPHPLNDATWNARLMCWASVIREEYEEFWEEARERMPNPERVLDELLQLAAMAQRAAENLDLVGREAE